MGKIRPEIERMLGQEILLGWIVSHTIEQGAAGRRPSRPGARDTQTVFRPPPCSVNRYASRREINASGATPRFDEDAHRVQLPEDLTRFGPLGKVL